MVKKILLALGSLLLLALPPLFWLGSAQTNTAREPIPMLRQYLKILYARDYRQAYGFIASADRQLKTRQDYVRERGAFSGFTLDMARKLAEAIEVKPAFSVPDGDKEHVKVSLKLPDANQLSALLLDWDEKRLNALPSEEQRKIANELDRLIRAKQLPMIAGDEEFVLVREGSRWKIFFDWSAGARVEFATMIPNGAALAAEALTQQTVARSGDPFTVGFKVTNRGAKELITRIIHRVEPKELAPFLDLVECALLLPVRVRPGESQTYNSTYVVRGDLPEGSKQLKVVYEFKIDNP